MSNAWVSIVFERIKLHEYAISPRFGAESVTEHRKKAETSQNEFIRTSNCVHTTEFVPFLIGGRRLTSFFVFGQHSIWQQANFSHERPRHSLSSLLHANFDLLGKKTMLISLPYNSLPEPYMLI